jgi:prepilin-type processing-associated H-X9-DG protein
VKRYIDSAFVAPASTALFMDAYPGTTVKDEANSTKSYAIDYHDQATSAADKATQKISFRHNGLTNVAYCDGHVGNNAWRGTPVYSNESKFWKPTYTGSND